MKNQLPKIIIGLLCLSLLAVPTLKAQDSDTKAATASSETTNTLRERIEKIVEQQKENVQSILGEFPNEMRGFVGRVTRVSETTLTLENRGATRIVPLTAEVVLMRAEKEILAETIEIDSWALVLGLTDGDSFTPRKITFTQNSLLPDPHLVLLGLIKDIKVRSLDIQSRGQEEIITATINAATKYQDSQGEEITLNDFEIDDQVLIVGYHEDNDAVVTVMRALAPLE